MEKNYKNIIIFALRKIGDTIIATSVAYLLKKAYPDAKISILVRPLSQEIVNNNPAIDEVILFNYTHSSSFSEMKCIADKLKVKRFDLAIVTDNKPRSVMIAWLANIPRRVGFENIVFRNIYLKLFYTDIINIEHDAMNTQQVKNHEIFINKFTGRNDRAKMIMANVMPSDIEVVDNLLKHAFKEQRKDAQNCIKIALCIRSGCLTKDWPLQRFSELIERLNKIYNAVFYIIGSKADLVIVNEFVQNIDVPVSVFCGKTSLVELSYLLDQSDLFITVDTGSAHIAATTKTQIVEMYGSTSPNKWGAYAENIINLTPKYHCHPCDGKKIVCKDPKCLLTVSVDEVFNACVKQLDKLESEKLISNTGGKYTR